MRFFGLQFYVSLCLKKNACSSKHMPRKMQKKKEKKKKVRKLKIVLLLPSSDSPFLFVFNSLLPIDL